MVRIKSLTAYPILDSSGYWTVEAKAEVETALGVETATGSVPTGISKSSFEAETVPYKTAIAEVNEIINPRLTGKEAGSQLLIDKNLKELKVGANSRLAVSYAVCKAAKNLVFPAKPLMPKLMMLMIEGGKHGSQNYLTFQEFMIIVDNIAEGVEIYHKLGEFLKKKDYNTNVGKEGGYNPEKLTDREALSILKEIAPGKQIALDIAASHQENFPSLDFKTLTASYPIFSLEDAYLEDDFSSWTKLTSFFGSQGLIVGDDLVATNPGRLKTAIAKKAINALVVKPNQIGTISEALEVVDIAKKAGLKIVVSQRGQETNETFLADFAVAVSADFVKFGAPARGERVAKYNRLLRLI